MLKRSILRASHSLYLLINKELLTTETELKAIAPAAIIGLSKNPNEGYKTPAAIGIPKIL